MTTKRHLICASVMTQRTVQRMKSMRNLYQVAHTRPRSPRHSSQTFIVLHLVSPCCRQSTVVQHGVVNCNRQGLVTKLCGYITMTEESADHVQQSYRGVHSEFAQHELIPATLSSFLHCVCSKNLSSFLRLDMYFPTFSPIPFRHLFHLLCECVLLCISLLFLSFLCFVVSTKVFEECLDCF